MPQRPNQKSPWRRQRSQRHQPLKSQHCWREYQRQRYYGLHQSSLYSMPRCNPPRQRQRHHQQNRRCSHGQPQRQPERFKIHTASVYDRERMLSCRTGRLRGARSLRDACIGLGHISCRGPRVARLVDSDQREDLSDQSAATRYKSHEVTARRAGGPSGRTHSTAPE